MSPDFIFTVVYFLLSVCFIYPPTEFLTAGVTIEHIFSSVLGNKHEDFILYHIKKSCIFLVFYSLLPVGYIFFSNLLGYANLIIDMYSSFPLLSTCFYIFAIVLPTASIYEILNWTRNNFEQHPISLNVSKFANNNEDWRFVARNINMEFRSVNKICLQTSSIITVIVTENWILKISPLTIHIAHQSDTSLVVKEAHTYQLSPNDVPSTQYLNIEVKSARQGVEPFIIRINAGDFKDLSDRVTRNITILPNVKFHKNVIEQFIDVFKETVKCNPRYENNEVLDKCIGCMQVNPNIKINKSCEDAADDPNKCMNCYCRPMWCCDCMAKWFASRQDSERENTWLNSKCTCPMCRATFCMVDVCLLSNAEVN
ncbi:unnamed protein product [Phyllotreta striolata]|uniref:E3 ubiquitin-protein ligase TM129 n=1 Tax=Phyllotreta striolata TaxID=444603 RepID=A0A9N9XND8_PHYSR|nr:unnamed protein product [Phyllotreta striolata]